jgi:hypothetical protein
MELYFHSLNTFQRSLKLDLSSKVSNQEIPIEAASPTKQASNNGHESNCSFQNEKFIPLKENGYKHPD